METRNHDDNLVDPASVCPRCGERDSDELIWLDDDSDRVRCQRCTHGLRAAWRGRRGRRP